MDIQWEPWAYVGLVCPTSLGTLTQTHTNVNQQQMPVICYSILSSIDLHTHEFYCMCWKRIIISTLCFIMKLLTSFKCYLVTNETCLVLLSGALITSALCWWRFGGTLISSIAMPKDTVITLSFTSYVIIKLMHCYWLLCDDYRRWIEDQPRLGW